MGCCRQRLQVSHLLVRIGEDFQIDTARIGIHRSHNFFGTREVDIFCGHTEAFERCVEQCKRVAKHVFGGHNVLPRCGHHKKSVADGRHTRSEGHNIVRIGEPTHSLFKETHCRISHARIVRQRVSATESIGHYCCIGKFVGGGVIDRHTDGTVRVRLRKGGMNGLGGTFHAAKGLRKKGVCGGEE